MATGGAGGAGGSVRRRRPGDPLPRDEYDDMLDNPPDMESFRRITLTLLAKKQERDRRAAAQAAAQAEVAREVEEHREEEEAMQATFQQIQVAADRQMMGVSLEEYHSEEVLLKLPPPQEADQDDIDVDAEYLGALTAARAALGLDDALPDLAASKADRLELFRAGLRSGYVRSTALRRGSAGAPLVDALLSTMTQSPDAEAAGAAFVTLMALMGDEAACGQQAAAAAASSGQAGDGGQAGARTASSLLLVDAHYGLAPGKPLPPCAMECVPTDQQLMEALRANGYRPGRGGGGGGKRRQQDQQQQLGQQQQEEEGGGEGQEGRAVRVQAVKLIFRTAAAVCRYCQRDPAAARGALGREGLGELLLAGLHLLLDPHAAEMAEDLEEGVAALLGAFDEVDWERKLPQLADRLAELGPSHHARFKLLRKLPAALPRGLALQQHGAALLLERLLPPPKSGHKSAISRRGGAELDPAAVIAGQWWFTKGKDLVVKATSGGQEVPRDGYAIGAVELLLKVCHLLLWPHMLRQATGEPSCVAADPGFLPAWHAFLGAVQKNVKTFAPEDQAVKAAANYYDLEFSVLLQDAGLAGPWSP